MTKFLLDTNICIYIIKQKPKKVLDRFLKQKVGDLAISTITLSELEYGVGKSSKLIQNKIALTEFLAPIEIIEYDSRAAEVYGNIRSTLEKLGKVIGPLDMLIAAHAVSHGLVLVTNNEKEFQRVPGLRLQNWSK